MPAFEAPRTDIPFNRPIAFIVLVYLAMFKAPLLHMSVDAGWCLSLLVCLSLSLPFRGLLLLLLSTLGALLLSCGRQRHRGVPGSQVVGMRV